MKNKIKRNLLFSILVVLLSFTADAHPLDPALFDIYINGDHAVVNTEKDWDLKLENQHGKTLELEDLKGKVVFINFWATWCPPCVVEMPDIDDLYKELKDDKDVVFLMISLDQSFDKAKQFLEKKGFDFDIYKATGSIPKELQTQAIPTTFILDREGNIAKRYLGAQSYNTDEFKSFLDEVKG